MKDKKDKKMIEKILDESLEKSLVITDKKGEMFSKYFDNSGRIKVCPLTMQKNQKITYIAELDQDVDDVVALEYLHKLGYLKDVVLDPYPVEPEGIARMNEIKKYVEVYDKIPKDTKIVFVGGALKQVAEYVEMNKLDWLVMNGGFVGNNIENHFELPKFKGKDTVRTFNFNSNIMATDKVLKSPNIKNIMLVGKNVCHNKKNTRMGIWKTDENLQGIFDKYGVNDRKLLHDLLACKEGLIKLGLLYEKSILKYRALKPYNEGIDGTYTKWGSCLPKNERSKYKVCYTAVDYKKQ